MQSPIRRSILLLTVALSALSGCQCSSVLQISGDGGTHDGGTSDGGKGGDGGTGTGGGGGGTATGGGGGSGGGFSSDAGDQSTTLGSGSFGTDGGTGGTGSGVKLDPNGNLILGGGSVDLAYMWIANNNNGWVSKFDTRTGKEIGRYLSVINRDCSNSAGPPCAGGVDNGLTGAVVQNPSRTAIDRHGDLWVANRAVGRSDVAMVGSVTKIANDPSGCIDRNGNGKIDTSKDLNGDGKISTVPADGEMIIPADYADPKQYDECVLFSTPIGGRVPTNSVGGRALAVAAGLESSGPGDIWVGIYHQQKIYKLDGNNGQILPVNGGGTTSLDIAFGPYGAIVDRLQRLWVVEPGSARLALIDTASGTVVAGSPSVAPINGNPKGCSAYGIGIDGKNRVWLPGWSAHAAACRYDRTTDTWTKFDFSAARSQTNTAFADGRGIAVDVNGQVYMSGYAGDKAQLIRFDAETGAIIPFNGSQFIDASDGNTNQSIGVALDVDGNPWVNNMSGNVMKVDQTTGVVTRTQQQPAGLYTYSDFTGYELRNYTAPHGTWTKDFEGCADVNTWQALSWTAVVPANSALQVFVRVADTAAGLADVANPRYGPLATNPADLDALGVPHKRFLRAFFELTSSDGTATPILKGMSLKWNCDGVIN